MLVKYLFFVKPFRNLWAPWALLLSGGVLYPILKDLAVALIKATYGETWWIEHLESQITYFMNKTKQTKERKREGVFSRVTFYPVGVLFDKSFNELLCILIKMFGRECIKYDNGNLSSNFWIGSASTSSLSLNQMLPSTTLLFKHKMHLNLLLEWNCGIRRFLWQIAFNSANGRFCITLYKSKIYDSFQLFIFSWNGQKQIQCSLSSSLPYFFLNFLKYGKGDISWYDIRLLLLRQGVRNLIFTFILIYTIFFSLLYQWAKRKKSVAEAQCPCFALVFKCNLMWFERCDFL